MKICRTRQLLVLDSSTAQVKSVTAHLYVESISLANASVCSN